VIISSKRTHFYEIIIFNTFTVSTIQNKRNCIKEKCGESFRKFDTVSLMEECIYLFVVYLTTSMFETI
jgi:hypothetical protein